MEVDNGAERPGQYGLASMPSPKQRISSKTITTSGWLITATKGPIMSDKDMDDCRHQLGDVLALPEMLFDQSRVELRHVASGAVISFSALDALRESIQEGVAPLQVQTAEKWRKSREADIAEQQAVMLRYDWTFTTPYAGSASVPLHADASTSAAATPAAAAAGEAVVSTSSHTQGADGGCTTSHAGAAWETTTEQIDRSLLMERDPILFFDEVLLYESDLDDNGVCQLSAKLRVMPKCWFVLLRFWLRVDGSMVRLREARLFCRHDRPALGVEVLREVKHCEGTFAELRAAGAPGEGPAYLDPDAAAQALGAAAPVGVKRFELHRLVITPPPAVGVPVPPASARPSASPVSAPAVGMPVPSDVPPAAVLPAAVPPAASPEAAAAAPPPSPAVGTPVLPAEVSMPVVADCVLPAAADSAQTSEADAAAAAAGLLSPVVVVPPPAAGAAAVLPAAVLGSLETLALALAHGTPAPV